MASPYADDSCHAAPVGIALRIVRHNGPTAGRIGSVCRKATARHRQGYWPDDRSPDRGSADRRSELHALNDTARAVYQIGSPEATVRACPADDALARSRRAAGPSGRLLILAESPSIGRRSPGMGTDPRAGGVDHGKRGEFRHTGHDGVPDRRATGGIRVLSGSRPRAACNHNGRGHRAGAPDLREWPPARRRCPPEGHPRWPGRHVPVCGSVRPEAMVRSRRRGRYASARLARRMKRRQPAGRGADPG